MVARLLVGGPFRRFDFFGLVYWTGGAFGATFVVIVCSAAIALLLSTIVYYLSARRVKYFWGYTSTRIVGAVLSAILGGVAGILTFLAGKLG